MTGVRQGECLSPFLFAIYLNDVEQEFIIKGADGVDTGFLKLFLRFMDFLRPGLFAGSPFATYDWSFRDPVFFAPFRP